MKPAITARERQGLIWDYYKPRHTHAWNMLVISWRELEHFEEKAHEIFEEEYYWENFIIRLWLYRTAVKTLTKLDHVKDRANNILENFDVNFDVGGKNGLKAIRDMIEHFDDYAAGKGHGPATRERDLDPWRVVTEDRFERGIFCLERRKSYEAANKLRLDAKGVSDDFIHWYKSSAESKPMDGSATSETPSTNQAD